MDKSHCFKNHRTSKERRDERRLFIWYWVVDSISLSHRRTTARWTMARQVTSLLD